jgi:transcriptional regulator with XRE-family HTH domain
MSSRHWMEESLADAEIRLAYEVEGLSLECAEAILAAYETLGLSQRAAAARIGMKESAVSRALSGDHNMTLETLAKLALAAGLRVKPELREIREADNPYRVPVREMRRHQSTIDFPRDTGFLASDDENLAA